MQFAEVTQPGPFSRLLKNPTVGRVAPAVGLLGCVGLAAVWKPSDTESVICVFRRVTGHWCPGCGLTRGVLAMLRGNVTTSFAYHPLAIVFLVQFVAYAAWRISGRQVSTDNRRTILIANTVALLLVFGYRSTLGSFPDPGSLSG